MTTVITGWNSTIAEEYRAIAPEREFVRADATGNDFPLDADRYLFCQGVLYPKRREDQTEDEQSASWEVNYSSIVRQCDRILKVNRAARICIIGSESGYRGSFDESYAEAKDALHRFIESKVIQTRGDQQLIGISPWIIGDAGMTKRRTDAENLDNKRVNHPMGRFLTSREVAEMVRFLLYDAPYVSGTVIRMHGGLS